MAAPRLWSFRASPFAGKVRVAFAEKGMEFELVDIHPAKRPARLSELNPLGRVPTLELDDGRALRESAAILEWIEETHPDPPLWPADPAERARARAWARFLDDNVLANFVLGMRKMAFGRADGDPEDIVERMHARMGRQWGRVEAALGEREGPWMCGEQFTYTDVAGMPAAVRLPEWAPHLVPDSSQHPRVGAWLAALRERPSAFAVDQAAPERVEA